MELQAPELRNADPRKSTIVSVTKAAVMEQHSHNSNPECSWSFEPLLNQVPPSKSKNSGCETAVQWHHSFFNRTPFPSLQFSDRETAVRWCLFLFTPCHRPSLQTRAVRLQSSGTPPFLIEHHF
ncbi:hypothetical protein Zmor_001981 [Zophobas morio]|uniref:Uncharacterized protein n=1 Tax=Zophobas morio TaxID=2755281 RepID=A0AA38J3P1_9CUCU|nr:hypothetical protein Zmor_001981 [Zophobas morio]